MQYQTKVNKILADVIRGTKKEQEYSIVDANKDIHKLFNGETESDIITFENEDGQLSAIDYLINECCIEFGITYDDIVGNRRFGHIIIARHTAMYLLYKYKAGTLYNIGRIFGNKDHSSVLHAVRGIKNIIDIGDMYCHKINSIEKRLLNYMGINETTLNTKPVINKPPFNTNLFIQEIKDMMRKSPLTTDKEILNNYKIERHTLEKILKLVDKIDNMQ